MQETNLIEQEQPVGAFSNPGTGSRSDDDAVLLRRKADPGGTCPSGNARRRQQPTNPFPTSPWWKS